MSDDRLRDVPQGVNEHYVGFARRIKGYGGHTFTPEGVMIVHLKDPATRSEALRVLEEDLKLYRQQRGHPVARIEVRRADFDYLDLTRWRSREVRRAVMNVPGVWLIRTSNEHNRIEVGVESPAAESSAREALAAAGVPLAAVMFSRVEEPTPDVDYLTSYASNLQGGRTIYTETGYLGSGGNCTAGAVGRGKDGTVVAGRTFILTASHCTQTLYGNDGTYFRQPDAWSDRFGHEAYDGRRFYQGDPSYSFYTCGYADGCRLTDAVLIEVTGRSATPGQIARPRATGGTLEIDAARPFFQVTALRSSFAVSRVQMVGQTSGWRAGDILDGDYSSDVRSPAGNGGYVWLLNVGIGTWYSQGGDSGAPLFEYSGSGDAVSLRGIHNGRITVNGTSRAYFSMLQAIHSDHAYANGVYILSDIEWRYGY